MELVAGLAFRLTGEQQPPTQRRRQHLTWPPGSERLANPAPKSDRAALFG
jgi:hypothetical protein